MRENGSGTRGYGSAMRGNGSVTREIDSETRGIGLETRGNDSGNCNSIKSLDSFILYEIVSLLMLFFSTTVDFSLCQSTKTDSLFFYYDFLKI